MRCTPSEVLGLNLATLQLWLDARESGIPLEAPESYGPFTVAGTPGQGLVLRIRDAPLRATEGWRSLYYDAQTWQLWLDGAGHRVFAAPRRSPPPRQVTIDASFRAGEVLGEFGPTARAGLATYPLQDIDMAIVVNWLAETGDLVVHASGIDDGGAGYAFVGPSGAGKSTLIGEVMHRDRVAVLGEDQVVLRRENGHTLVYGTPWHTDPQRCSMGGVPLRKLFFLDRAASHSARPCAYTAGVERLMQDAFIPYYNRPGIVRILDTLSQLAQEVPFYTLGFQIGADVLSLIRDA